MLHDGILSLDLQHEPILIAPLHKAMHSILLGLRCSLASALSSEGSETEAPVRSLTLVVQASLKLGNSQFNSSSDLREAFRGAVASHTSTISMHPDSMRLPALISQASEDMLI